MRYLSLLLGVAFFGNTLVAASTPLPLQERDGGRLHLGVGYGVTPQKYVWHIQFRTRLSSEELDELPDQVYWNFYHQEEDRFLREWTPVPRYHLKRAHLFEHDRPTLTQLLPAQPMIRIVFAVKEGSDFVPRYHYDFGELCAAGEFDYFVDLSWRGKRCDKISLADLPNSPERCAELAADLDSYVSRRTMSCDEAQAIFRDKGCEYVTDSVFDCGLTAN